METSNPTPIQEDQELITFTHSIKNDLRIASYWSKIIAIFSLLLLTFSLFSFSYFFYTSFTRIGISLGEILAEAPSEFYAFFLFMIGILIVLILASLALLNFSFEIKKAVDEENAESLNLAIKLLLNFFRYSGLTIIAISVAYFLLYLLFKITIL